ncbi:hypothetical protein, partial [Streptomyces toxytricini]|uniref:hypothetical protein n=1 Tax=Streptomyces toxytricini TaxID=67369 RepID=UPI003437F557
MGDFDLGVLAPLSAAFEAAAGDAEVARVVVRLRGGIRRLGVLEPAAPVAPAAADGAGRPAAEPAAGLTGA